MGLGLGETRREAQDALKVHDVDVNNAANYLLSINSQASALTSIEICSSVLPKTII
jgi:hypothetical protein